MKKSLSVFALFVLGASGFALAQDVGPLNITADTGNHTCTSVGQEGIKVESVKAPDHHFITRIEVGTKTAIGEGDCVLFGPGRKRVKVKTPSGSEIEVDVPVSYDLRARADCQTGSHFVPGRRIGRECVATYFIAKYD